MVKCFDLKESSSVQWHKILCIESQWPRDESLRLKHVATLQIYYIIYNNSPTNKQSCIYTVTYITTLKTPSCSDPVGQSERMYIKRPCIKH